MPNVALDELIQRYKQELLQYQSRSAATSVPLPTDRPSAHPSAPESSSAPTQPAVPSPGSPGTPDPLPSPTDRPSARPSAPESSFSPAQTPIPFPTPECRDRYTDSGKLRISVYAARQALPVSNADVTVFCLYDQTERLHYFLKTDQSGNTPAVSLPAPPAALSESPGDTLPYAVYGVRAHADGFIPSEIRNVQVFSGITGTVSFDLIPASGPSLPISSTGRE